jgi:cation diffusion facilitator family transporter
VTKRETEPTDNRQDEDPRDGGKTTVYAALAANCGIAVTKFIAAGFSGSSAMLAEGIHSTVDTANQGFLLLGMARAKKPADDAHPFGYGVEIYFWAFIVAVLIFALGSGLSIYEGIRALLHGGHEAEGVPWIPFGVLAASFCFEGYSLSVAAREFTSVRKHRGLVRDLQDLKDPSIFVVLAEDSAACIGVVIAAIGLTLSWLTGNPFWDAAASIAIGILLGITAAFLSIEVKGLLIGESTDPDIVATIRGRVEAYPEIITINEIRSLHLGPSEVLLTLSIDFRDDVVSQRIEEIVTETEKNIRRHFPIVRRVYLEVQSRSGHDEMSGSVLGPG